MKALTRIIMVIAVSVIMMPCICTFDTAYAGTVKSIPWDGTISQPQKLVVKDNIYYYEISTPEELAYIAEKGGDWVTYNYRLANDIVLNDETLSYDSNGELTIDKSQLIQWTPIKGFKGIFDGNGHSVSGVYIDSKYEAAMFKFAYNGSVIKNLTIENAYIKGGDRVGGIATTSMGILSNCSFDGAAFVYRIDEDGPGDGSVGGIVSFSEDVDGLVIENCINYGDIFGIKNTSAGGIIGEDTLNSFMDVNNSVEVKDCKNHGTIKSEGIAGGIVGEDCYIDGCINYGNVEGGNYTGGISGRSEYMHIHNAMNYGSVYGDMYVGGISGWGIDVADNSEQFNLMNVGNISGKEYVGGILGFVRDMDRGALVAIRNISNSGNVTGDSTVGGLFGNTSYLEISDGYNIGKVTGRSKTGSLIGYNDEQWGRGKTSNCYYLKNSTVNSNITAFGNMADTEGVISRKSKSSFCIGNDNVVQTSGHKKIRVSVVEATCTKTGQAKEICSECDIVIVKQKTIKAKGHSYVSSYTVDKKATTSTDGSKSKHCKRSGCNAKTSMTTIQKISSVKLSSTSLTYNGKKKSPYPIIKNATGKQLKRGTDYTVSYGSSKRSAVGRYSVKVTFKGSYKGTKTMYFNILPKAPSKVTTTLYGNDDVKVKWSKVTGADGYCVYYKKSASSSYKLLKRTTGTSVKKANLSDGVKYTFKVVPYFKSGDKRYQSSQYKLSSIYTLK